MNEDETFEQFFLSRFKQAQILGGATDDQAFAVISSRGMYNEIGMQCLPERFHPHIEVALREAKSLDDFRRAMVYAESIMSIGGQHQKGSNNGNDIRKKAHAVNKGDHSNCLDRRLKCINCYNQGHESKGCKLRACSGCQTWQSDHKKHNYPGKKRPASFDSKKQFRKKDDNDDESEGDNSSQSSKSSNKSTKSNFSKKDSKKSGGKRPGTPRHKKSKGNPDEEDQGYSSSESDYESDDEFDGDDDKSQTSFESQNSDDTKSPNYVRFKPARFNDEFDGNIGQTEGFYRRIYSLDMRKFIKFLNSRFHASWILSVKSVSLI